MENLNPNSPSPFSPPLLNQAKSSQRYFGKKLNNNPQRLQSLYKPSITKESKDSRYPWKVLNKSTSSCSLFSLPTKVKLFSVDLRVLRQCDEKVKAKPQYVTDYINDILVDMFLNNSVNKPEWGYFEITQEEINLRMRAVLIDWLLEVHLKFKYRQETFYLCVIIVDRFLSKKKVTQDKLQLYGITSFFISAKFEELYPSSVKDIIYITNFSYSKEDIIKAEGEILSALDFNLLAMYPYTILQRLHFMSGFSIEVFHLAQYILELSMFDYLSLSINDYVKALSSLYMAKTLMKAPGCFTEEMKEMLKISRADIKKFCFLIVKTVKCLVENKLHACYSKFKSKDFSSVSLSYLTQGPDTMPQAITDSALA